MQTYWQQDIQAIREALFLDALKYLTKNYKIKAQKDSRRAIQNKGSIQFG